MRLAMQLAVVVVFAVICELLTLSSLDRDSILIQVTAQSQSGFVSIDCGGSDTNYTHDGTYLSWTPGFGLDKVSRVTNVSLPASTYPWLSSMRIFEGTQTKYCYEFDESYGIMPTNPYLIRASFWTGDKWPFSTPNKDQLRFKLLINADEWEDIVISLPQKNPLVKEVYVLTALSRISACVAGSSDPPFISSQELRPIGNNWDSVSQFMHNTAPKLMFLYARLDMGSSTGKDIRWLFSLECTTETWWSL